MTVRRWLGLSVMVVAMAVLAGCTRTRAVPVISDCDTAVFVTWSSRTPDGAQPTHDDFVIPPGRSNQAEVVDFSSVALLDDDDRVIAETSLPVDRLDDNGDNAFPEMRIPAEVCGRLRPAPAADGGQAT